MSTDTDTNKIVAALLTFAVWNNREKATPEKTGQANAVGVLEEYRWFLDKVKVD